MSVPHYAVTVIELHFPVTKRGKKLAESFDDLVEDWYTQHGKRVLSERVGLTRYTYTKGLHP